MNNLHTVSFGVATLDGYGLESVLRKHLPGPEYEYTIGENFLTLPTPGYLSGEMLRDWTAVSRFHFAWDVLMTAPLAIAHAYKIVLRESMRPFYGDLWVTYAPGSRLLSQRKVLFKFIEQVERIGVLCGLAALLSVFACSIWALVGRFRGSTLISSRSKNKALIALMWGYLVFSVAQPLVIVFGDGFFGLGRHVQFIQLGGQAVLLCGVTLISKFFRKPQ